MPETQTVTVNAYHPYPAFYWEFKLAGGVAADIEGYDAYINADNSDPAHGQGFKTVGINATIDDVGSIRCTIGPESAGVPTPGAEGTVTTDWIPVSVGTLTWDVNPDPKNVTIQAQTAGPLMSVVVTDESTTVGKPVLFRCVPYNGKSTEGFTYDWSYSGPSGTSEPAPGYLSIDNPSLVDNGATATCTASSFEGQSSGSGTLLVEADVTSAGLQVKHEGSGSISEFYHSFAAQASVGDFTYTRADGDAAGSISTCQTSPSTLAVLATNEAGFVNGTRNAENDWSGPCTGIQLEAGLTQLLGATNDMDSWKWSLQHEEGGSSARVEWGGGNSPAGTTAWLYSGTTAFIFQSTPAQSKGTSIWARTTTGTGTINLIARGELEAGALFTLTETWQRIDFPMNYGDYYGFDQRYNGADLPEIVVYGAQACDSFDFPTSTAVATATGPNLVTRKDAHCTGTLTALDGGAGVLPASLTNDFCVQITYAALAAVDELPASGMIPLCLQDAAGTAGGSIYFHHAVTTGLITVYLNGTSYAATAVTPSRGDTIDLRLRKTEADGLSIWVDGTKTVHSGATDALGTAADTLLINEGGQADSNHIVGWGHYAMVRVIPEAATDQYVQDLTDQPAA